MTNEYTCEMGKEQHIAALLKHLRCKNKVSAYILVTGELRSVDLPGETISWIGSPWITQITNFNGVHVGKITPNC